MAFCMRLSSLALLCDQPENLVSGPLKTKRLPGRRAGNWASASGPSGTSCGTPFFERPAGRVQTAGGPLPNSDHSIAPTSSRLAAVISSKRTMQS